MPILKYSRRCPASKTIGLKPNVIFYKFIKVMKSKEEEKLIY
jgi:hypothetical protein